MSTRSAAVLVLFWAAAWGAALDDSSRVFVLQFVRQSRVSGLVGFSCGGQGDLSLVKFLSSHGVMSQLFDLGQPLELARVLGTASSQLAVLLTLSCEGGRRLLEQASDAGLFSRRHHWLILSPDATTLENALRRLPLPLDSHVTTALRGEEDWELRDAYQTGVGQPLILTASRRWAPGEALPPPPPRDDLQGITLKTVIVVVEDDWAHHDDLRFKHLDTWTKFNYHLMGLVAYKLNFTIDRIFTDTWGYPRNGSFDGMVGLLQRGEADIGGGGIAMKTLRMDTIEYTAETAPFRPQFLLRQPMLSAVTNIYTLPFSPAVWATYLSTVLGLTAILVATERLMRRYVSSAEEEPPPQWRDVVFRACSILCDEGYPTTPDCLSSRIVLLFMLILAVFHLTSYSACVVSLLQTPSTGFDSLEELLNSPIKIAMQDIPYNVKFINETSNPLVRRLYWERLYSVPRGQAFPSLEQGVERVRAGLFAFHVDISAYKLVGDTFLEHEKCGLKTVPMFPEQLVSLPVRKGSPYREHFTRTLRLMKETGLIHREFSRWTTPKPECKNRDSGFVSVGLQEFCPVLNVLLVGLVGAATLLLLELLLHRGHCRGPCQKRRGPSFPQLTLHTPTEGALPKQGRAIHFLN